MANNHGVDYGPVGLADSLAAIRAHGFPVVGIGADAAHAYAPYRTTMHGASHRDHRRDPGARRRADLVVDRDRHATPASRRPRRSTALVAAVRAARATSDTVVVFLHWGSETQHVPDADPGDARPPARRRGRRHRRRLARAPAARRRAARPRVRRLRPRQLRVLLAARTDRRDRRAARDGHRAPRRPATTGAGRDQRRRAAAARGRGRDRGAQRVDAPAAVAPTSHREVDCSAWR